MTNPNQSASHDDDLSGDGETADVEPDSADASQPIEQPARQTMGRGRQTVRASALTCVRCDYNLTGMTIGGSCPECGAPVNDSIAGLGVGVSSRKAVASMVLGICALPSCLLFYGIPAFVLGILAVILGYSALRDIREGKVSATARSLAMTGIMCGRIAATVVVVAIIIYVIFLPIYGP